MATEPTTADPPAARPPSRTRDHLANERTFLAWVRTALGLVGLGFVLARMGLFLRELGEAVEPRLRPTSAGGEFLLAGVVFLLLGTAFAAWSASIYSRGREAIEADRYEPAGASIRALAAVVVAGGAVLATLVVWRILTPGA